MARSAVPVATSRMRRGRRLTERCDRLPAPVQVHPAAQQMVEQVVPVSDGVEEGTDVGLFQR